MPNSTSLAQFEVSQYLEQRAANPDLLMVEFGHGRASVAYQQPFHFDGNRAYIGVESWLRDSLNFAQRDLADKKNTNQDDPNTFFLSQDVGGWVDSRYENDKRIDEYIGDYEPTTLLPTGSADEVFAGNVFGDPLIASSPDRTRALLLEMDRVAASAGTVILRETISPEAIDDVLLMTIIEEAGMTIKKGAPVQSKVWTDLELLYCMPRYRATQRPAGSFYLFLGASAKG